MDRNLRPIAGLADDIWRDIKMRHDTNPGAITGLSTGFSKLDDLIDGVRPETLIIIGARPKQGKTALLLSIMMNMAKADIKTAFFSLEMPEKQVISRLIAIEAEVSHQLMVRGIYTEEEGNRLEVAIAEVSDWPLIIDDTAGLTPSAFTDRAQRAVDDGARAVFLDYLQLMRPDKSAGKRYEVVTEVSMAVANARKIIKAPIIAAAQLNRKVVDRASKPTFSSIKNSIEEVTRPNDGDLRELWPA